jgi:putative peptide zinc metalloprotease protein
VPTLADSLVSSSARRLPIRKRPDLAARLHRYQGRAYWVVKDPLGLNYFRFQEEEFAILNMLDGEASLDEVKERFEAEFPPQKITVEELQQFIGMLHRSGLVITGAPDQGKQLKKRRDERKRQEWIQMLSNILALRFKGIDPNRLLDWMEPKFRFCFTRMGIFVWFAVCLSALLLVTVQFDVFQSKLPEFEQFFGPSNWFWLGLTLALTKVCHEFGHGLSCKHFGGECHEIGVMLLVLTPCLYCNVSDSWMLPNKWRRAMIGAAGMYVELFIASVCTFIWWYSEPGLLNNLALNVMFICSVSTVVFNANPLLRYDGYYILADIVEIPNLRQKSTKVLTTLLNKYCLGLDEPEDPFLPKRNKIFFAIYTVAAVIYRWFVLFSILFFLYHVFKPYGLQIIGQIIGVTSIVGLVGVPAWKIGKFFYIPGRIDRVKKKNLYISLAVLAAIIAAIIYVPLPHHILAVAEIRPFESDAVVVTEAGRMVERRVEPGMRVQQGDVLAILINEDLDREVRRLEGQLAQYEKSQAKLRRDAFTGDREAAAQLAVIRKSIESTRAQIAERTRQIEQLTLRAGSAGVVLPPASLPGRPMVDGGLPTMSGSPFDDRNLGAPLRPEQEFCLIAEPGRWKAVVIIDQSDIEFVQKGQSVELLLDHKQTPRGMIRTTLADVAPKPMDFAPKSLSNKSGGELATETDPETGRERPQGTHYEAFSAELAEEYSATLRNGLRGQAKIRTIPLSIGQRFWRFVKQTFNFHL